MRVYFLESLSPGSVVWQKPQPLCRNPQPTETDLALQGSTSATIQYTANIFFYLNRNIITPKFCQRFVCEIERCSVQPLFFVMPLLWWSNRSKKSGKGAKRKFLFISHREPHTGTNLELPRYIADT
jgi:hypothetical protein